MKYITDINDLDLNGTYTYADYLTWRFEQSVELIKGKIFKMSPAPSRKHQKISGKLYVKVFMAFQKNACEVYSAPFDVRLLDKKKSLKANTEIYTVVQPDICVICDKSKLDERGCIGAPDLIIEILSPGNSKKEMRTKYALYEESGVKEYWVLYPSEHVLQQYILNENEKYELKNNFAEDEIFNSHIFSDLQIDLSEIFEEEEEEEF
ncbi:Uma2 family endonuclease [Hugenholtzia roseola]|uniref:Uma2 family endonuclease n=1 Tax=Hugenholtzia roseola TaxID=1002 RepID=UPI0003FDAF80|nr:Uma2 family endonuclease [Hugenholtzia roseola]